jgi:hypothetical protein
LPVPVRGRLRLGFVASLVNATLPFTVPLVDGAKVTEKLVLAPAARLAGRLSPLRLKPDPETTALEMVTLFPPELVSVAVWVCVLPVCTLPKSRLPGATLSCPEGIPSPDMLTDAETLVD